MKRLRTFLIALAGAASLLVFASGPALAACSDKNLSTQEAIQCGVQGAGGGASTTPEAATDRFNTTLTSILNVFSAIVGIIAIIMIIWGGFRYVTSGGAQDKVTSAKNTILYAIIGLIIVALAQIIVRFVLDKATTTTSGSNSSEITTCNPSTESNCVCSSQGCIRTGAKP